MDRDPASWSTWGPLGTPLALVTIFSFSTFFLPPPLLSPLPFLLLLIFHFLFFFLFFFPSSSSFEMESHIVQVSSNALCTKDDLERLPSPSHWDRRHAQLHAILRRCHAGEQGKSLRHAKQAHYRPSYAPVAFLSFLRFLICEVGRHPLSLPQKDIVRVHYGHA